MTPLRLQRCVVLGCGIAGMAAAAALRRVSDEVVIAERDALPAGPARRAGVPQDEQLHNLLGRAQRHLDELLPGFCDLLRRTGAGDAAVAQDTHVYELGARMPERDLGLRLMCAPRPLIEHTARRLLIDGGGVTLRDGTRAVALDLTAQGAVRGVVLEVDGARETLAADVVVDATGARSRAAHWLRAHGCDAPPVHTARVSQWYVSMPFERPPHRRERDAFWLVFPTPPRTRGGLVAPSGPTEWCVALSGRAGDTPPRDAEQFRAYAATLEDPWIAELLHAARPVGPAHLFRKPTARWRRYDLQRTPVAGFLPIGDAVASLNPLFGQGMSVAAWQATALAESLERSARVAGPAALRELTTAFHARAAAAVHAAWALGDVVGGLPFDDDIADAVRDDPALHRRYVRVWHLLEPASSLHERPRHRRADEVADRVALR